MRGLLLRILLTTVAGVASDTSEESPGVHSSSCLRFLGVACGVGSGVPSLSVSNASLMFPRSTSARFSSSGSDSGFAGFFVGVSGSSLASSR